MRLLLLIPFVGLLWVPFYDRALPALFGIPFFYWYQFAWVPITSGLIWLVYRHGVRHGDGDDATADGTANLTTSGTASATAGPTKGGIARETATAPR